MSRDPWETLDREGLLEPVAYARHATWQHDQPGCLDDGDLKIREDAGYLSWDQQAKEAEEKYGEQAGVQILYHYWQFLWLAELQRHLEPPTPWGNLGDGLDVFFEMRSRCAAVPEHSVLDDLRVRALGHRTRELLLIRVQNVFFPFQRGDPRHSNWLGTHIPGLTRDADEWAMEQLRTLDYAELASDCGVDANELNGIYDQLLYRGLGIDPAKELFELLDQIRRSRRDRLTGPARLALDYFDAARMIRSWHTRLTNEELPNINEHLGYNGTEYTERHYGTLDVRGNRAVLPVLLEDYGLYPWRVHLIGEGDSEIAALREILEEGHGLTFETLGIAVVDMGGANIPAKAERLLSALRGYANYFLIVFDNEGNTRELIDELVRSKVIEGVSDDRRASFLKQAADAAKQIEDADARQEALQAARQRSHELEQEPGEATEFVLWRESFEADNFTIEDMLSVLRSYAEEASIEGLAMSVEDVEQALAEPKRGPGDPKGIASTILELAERQTEQFRLSKPDFARKLAVFALDNPEHEGQTRPILELAQHLVQLTWADRRLAGELRGR
ncbi:MAG: hypothetical protein H0X28_01400 [Solirubrobacterales bacterium]|nr:hypothetical protein [Solirubrobacterales bacterium]